MIVSFSRGFAFVAVPRTGTHAVRAHLRPSLAATDWEQCTRFEQRLCPVPELAALGHGHVAASRLRAFLIPGLWEQLTSFAFIREPLERFVSAYFLLHRETAEQPDEALERMKRMLGNGHQRRHVLLAEQAELVCNEHGDRLVDMLGRHDRLEADLAAICRRIGLPMPHLSQLNAATYPAGFEPDNELRDLVVACYVRDYALYRSLDGPKSCS